MPIEKFAPMKSNWTHKRNDQKNTPSPAFKVKKFSTLHLWWLIVMANREHRARALKCIQIYLSMLLQLCVEFEQKLLTCFMLIISNGLWMSLAFECLIILIFQRKFYLFQNRNERNSWKCFLFNVPFFLHRSLPRL